MTQPDDEIGDTRGLLYDDPSRSIQLECEVLQPLEDIFDRLTPPDPPDLQFNSLLHDV